MNPTRINGLLGRAGASIITLLCLLSAALWNRYPIVYSDTSSYLVSGFHLETLIDRPITYGLFIRVCSFNGWSLWTVVIAQAMLLAYVAGLALRSLGCTNVWARTAIIGCTALLSGLPFVIGQIITDVFTPILVITLFLLLFAKDLPKRTRILLFSLFLLAFATHMSHISITILLLILAWIIRLLLRQSTRGRSFWTTIAAIIMLSTVGSLAMGVSLAKSKYSFYAAHLAEIGVLQRYLEEHCPTEHYRLCSRLGNIPHSADAFLWADDTPLKVYESRKQMETELGHITLASLTEPRLLAMQIESAFKSSLTQLVHFSIGEGNGAFGKGTLLHERIGAFIPSEIGAFDHSRQMNADEFRNPVNAWNLVLNFVMACSAIALSLLWIANRDSLARNSLLKSLTLFLVGAMLINSAVNASLVMVADRFGAKLAWLVPFLTITTFMLLYYPRNKTSME
ncbi:MAG: hypothetical protein JST38_08985 [Bacteroidetes bacterium]|nr:hypothetical protein [Bacteroidota bacterium]MBS1940996.1 hypothetical protein [Bacteroidota bacterium]